MPFPLPDKKNITVQFKSLPAKYCMPAMQMATDHYSLGYLVNGDRRTITPLRAYVCHAGSVNTSLPFMPHRTLPGSDAPYEGYLIKFSEEIKSDFCEQIGKNIFDELYSQNVWYFSEESREKIKHMFHEMLEEYEKETVYQEVILHGMLNRLLVTIWEKRTAANTINFPTPLTEPILDAIAYISEQFSQTISLEDTARFAGLSPAYFSRLFHAQLGMSFSDYVSNVRMEHAKIQLAKTKKSVTEIALESGFCNGDYFSTQFKARTGMTPTAFRKTM